MIDIIKIALISYTFYALGEPGEIFAFYQRWINKLPEYLWKPLGGCFKCFAGQVAFWYFIFFKEYDLIEHLFFVSAVILFVMIINKIYCYAKND